MNKCMATRDQMTPGKNKPAMPKSMPPSKKEMGGMMKGGNKKKK